MDATSGWIITLSGILFLLSLGAFLRRRPQAPRRSLASQVKLLAKVPIFSTLAADHLERVAKVMRELVVPENVFVIRESRVGESMFFILKGQLDILKRGTHEQTLVQTVGPGELIGEMALLTGARRIASAKTLTSCHLLQIDRDDFNELFHNNPSVLAAVWDACEVHSIGLMMADYQQTRTLPLTERQEWIAGRTLAVVTEGERKTPPFAGFLAVISGSVTVNERAFDAPTLVRVSERDTVICRQEGRLCWLATLEQYGRNAA